MAENTMTIRKGLLFRSGDYPDRDFAITNEELRAAAASFQPVAVNLEHKASVLDGNLGTLRKVEFSADGALTGEYEEPTWLGQILGDTPRKISLEWDRAKKTICGMALVLSPRISEAAVFAAFSQSASADAIDWEQVSLAQKEAGFHGEINATVDRTLAGWNQR
jgi:hypothetical protein